MPAANAATRRWSAAAAENPEDPIGAVIALYLNLQHREERMDGCPLVALGADAGRQGTEVKASFEAGIKVKQAAIGTGFPHGMRPRQAAPAARRNPKENRCDGSLSRAWERSRLSLQVSRVLSASGSGRWRQP